MIGEHNNDRDAASHDNYIWEETFGDEKGRPLKQAQPLNEPAGNFDSSAILQGMLKNAPAAGSSFSLAENDAEGYLLQKAPLMPAVSEESKLSATPRPTSSAVQNLLKLAEEAENQARLTAEAADTANKLAAELIGELQNGGEDLLQLCITAGKNAYLAAEAAVRAQLSAMETHAAAVNQSLAELENAKDALHHHSQGFIQLSKLTAQTQDEAELAREKAERSRLEYASRQNAALGNRDALAQSKREYETKLNQARFAQENLDLAQVKAKNAHKEYLQLKESLAERRKQWQTIQGIKPQPVPTEPASAKAPLSEPVPPEPISQGAPEPLPLPATPPVRMAKPAPDEPITYEAAAQRRQIAALVMPAPLPDAALGDSEALAQTAEEEEEPAPKNSFLRIYGRLLLIALALALCLRLFVLDIVMVDGISMQPTLQNSDSLISSKVSYLFQEPKRFDIILMDAPDENGYYIKRVIGLPNEHLRIEAGRVFINDAPLTEEFLIDVQTDGEINTVIPDGYYFVMGDNRPASRDSRVEGIGSIAKEHITGKAIVRIFPLNTMKIL